MTRRRTLASLATTLFLVSLTPAAAFGHNGDGDDAIGFSPDLPMPHLNRLEGVHSSAAAADSEPSAGPTLRNFELVGHDPLFDRGMNAAPASFGHYMYVGSRTDGSPQHPHAGVLVVDVADPSKPKVVGEIGPPNEGNIGETSRELRVLPDQGLLIVMNFGCSAILHVCTSGADVFGTLSPSFKFYDVRKDPENPPLVATYVPPRTPHEMFLWTDPQRPGRSLLYFSTPTSSTTRPNLIVTDVSNAREGVFPELVRWIGNDEFTQDDRDNHDVRLHSIGVTVDGRRTYLAYLGAGFLVLDTSQIADAVAKPKVTLITKPADRVAWGDPGAHTAVEMPGHPDLSLTTTEVYGDLLDPITGQDHGCPWGWVRLIDISDAAHPKVFSEYKIAQNKAQYCSSPDGQDPTNTYFTSYASHNPTLLPDVAFVTWHSGGLQAIDLRHPRHLRQAGVFLPEPESSVATEDPALSLGRSKVVAWSYPIIRDGLIYFVDDRNGLYILRYTGEDAKDVGQVQFLEGNSTLGDAARLAGGK